jgi:hypothetical protein
LHITVRSDIIHEETRREINQFSCLQPFALISISATSDLRCFSNSLCVTMTEFAVDDAMRKAMKTEAYKVVLALESLSTNLDPARLSPEFRRMIFAKVCIWEERKFLQYRQDPIKYLRVCNNKIKAMAGELRLQQHSQWSQRQDQQPGHEISHVQPHPSVRPTNTRPSAFEPFTSNPAVGAPITYSSDGQLQSQSGSQVHMHTHLQRGQVQHRAHVAPAAASAAALAQVPLQYGAICIADIDPCGGSMTSATDPQPSLFNVTTQNNLANDTSAFADNNVQRRHVWNEVKTVAASQASTAHDNTAATVAASSASGTNLFEHATATKLKIDLPGSITFQFEFEPEIGVVQINPSDDGYNSDSSDDEDGEEQRGEMQLPEGFQRVASADHWDTACLSPLRANDGSYGKLLEGALLSAAPTATASARANAHGEVRQAAPANQGDGSAYHLHRPEQRAESSVVHSAFDSACVDVTDDPPINRVDQDIAALFAEDNIDEAATHARGNNVGTPLSEVRSSGSFANFAASAAATPSSSTTFSLRGTRKTSEHNDPNNLDLNLEASLSSFAGPSSAADHSAFASAGDQVGGGRKRTAAKFDQSICPTEAADFDEFVRDCKRSRTFIE